MVLGCILCEQPLVIKKTPKHRPMKNYVKEAMEFRKNLSDKLDEEGVDFEALDYEALEALIPPTPTLVPKSKRGPTPHPYHEGVYAAIIKMNKKKEFPKYVSKKAAEKRQQADVENKHDYQVVASKCGHMFHRGCLKVCIAQQLETSCIGHRCECPFCGKLIGMSNCSPVYLEVPDEDLLVEKQEALLDENERLHRQILFMRDKTIPEKEAYMEEYQRRLAIEKAELAKKAKAVQARKDTGLDEKYEALRKELDATFALQEKLSLDCANLVGRIAKASKKNQAMPKEPEPSTSKDDIRKKSSHHL